MSLIIFRLAEAMERYKVSGKALAETLGVSQSAVSQWRQGNAKPDLERLDEILGALVRLGDPERLELFPLKISDILDWRFESEN